MNETRVTSVELHQKLGQTIDQARIEPVIVTKHDREHVVVLSAEYYTFLKNAAQKARLTGSLTEQERLAAMAATVPSETEQQRLLAQFAEAVEAKPAS